MKTNEELKNIHGEEYVKAFKDAPRSRLTRLIKYIKVDKTHNVADFGCGNGMLMEFIAPQVNSYVGVDFSEPFISAAIIKKNNLKLQNTEFICMDINEFCAIHPATFDTGFAMDLSEHVYDAEWLRILKSIRKSVKPNGKFYLHTPNGEYFLEMMKRKNFMVKQFEEHVAVRTPNQNVNLLREAGFKVETVKLIPHYNYILWTTHLLSFLPVVGKYFRARIFIVAFA